MYSRARLYLVLILGLTCLLGFAQTARAQQTAILHTIEGRIEYKNGTLGGMRVRLVRKDSLVPVAETITRPEGGFIFNRLTDGDYLVETFETDVFEASSTEVVLIPDDPPRSLYQHVFIELQLKSAPAAQPAGVLTADVDLNVPKAARKHYDAGMKALDRNDTARAITEFQQAISINPDYYAARLELGRELRLKKQFKEAEEVLRPLPNLAPKRAEARLEYGVVLLELRRPDEAAAMLRRALELEETNWATHLYLGWSLIESRSTEAEPHFRRALELNERKAVRAHLALARLADAAGQRQLALQHLEAFIKLAPDAPEAGAARSLADRLRQ